MEHVPCPALPLARGPHTSGPLPPRTWLLTLCPLRKKRQPPGCVPRGDFHPQRRRQGMCERRAQKAPPGWSLEMGMAPTSCPSCPLPAPPCCPEPPAQPAPPMPLRPVPPAPSGGVCRSQELCLHPRLGRLIPHCVTSLHGLPRARPQPPAPFSAAVLFSFPPCPPPLKPPPSCPTDAPQMGPKAGSLGQPLPAPFPAAPAPAAGPSEGGFVSICSPDPLVSHPQAASGVGQAATLGRSALRVGLDHAVLVLSRGSRVRGRSLR